MEVYLLHPAEWAVPAPAVLPAGSIPTFLRVVRLCPWGSKAHLSAFLHVFCLEVQALSSVYVILGVSWEW